MGNGSEEATKGLVHYLEMASQCRVDSMSSDNWNEIESIVADIIDTAVEKALAKMPQPKPVVATRPEIAQVAINSLNAIAISVHAICDETLTHHQKNERLRHVQKIARQQIDNICKMTGYEDF